MTQQIVLKATGTEFIFGNVFLPSLNDCTAVLDILHRQGSLAPAMPPGTDVGVLLDRDFLGIKRVLPQVIGNMGVYFDMYQSEWVWPEMDVSYQYLIWVLLCYNYRINYGIRPAVPGINIPTRVRTKVNRFICPFCGKDMEVDPVALDSERAREYVVQLVAHYVHYHQWFSIVKFLKGFQSSVLEVVESLSRTVEQRMKEAKANEKAKESRSTKLVKHEQKLSKQVPNREIKGD